MSQTLRQEGEFVQTLDGIHKHLVRFRTERYETASRAHADGEHLVGVDDFGHRVRCVTVPEVDRSSLATRDELTLIVAPLGHAEEASIFRLVTVNPFFLFKVVG